MMKGPHGEGAGRLEHAKLVRSGGIAGVEETVELRLGAKGLRARVTPFLADAREFEVDAVRTGEITEVLERAMDSGPAEPRHQGADMYHYVLEIVLDGRRARHDVSGTPTDEALHSAIRQLSCLLAPEPSGD